MSNLWCIFFLEYLMTKQSYTNLDEQVVFKQVLSRVQASCHGSVVADQFIEQALYKQAADKVSKKPGADPEQRFLVHAEQPAGTEHLFEITQYPDGNQDGFYDPCIRVVLIKLLFVHSQQQTTYYKQGNAGEDGPLYRPAFQRAVINNCQECILNGCKKMKQE